VKFLTRKIFIIWSLLLLSCTQDPVMVENKAIQKTSSGKISTASSNPFKVKAKSGDTLYNISKQYGVGIRDLIELNKLRPPYTLENDQYIRLPQAAFHMVQPRDTLYAISRSYGVDIGRIVHLNNLSEPYVIKSGMKLLIPSSAYVVDVAEENHDVAPMPVQPEDNHSRDVVATDLAAIDAKPAPIQAESTKVVATPEANELEEEVRLSDKPIDKSDEVVFEKQSKPSDVKPETPVAKITPAEAELQRKIADEAKQNPEEKKTAAVAPAPAKINAKDVKNIAPAKVYENSGEAIVDGKIAKAIPANLPQNSKVIEPVFKPVQKEAAVETTKVPATPVAQKDSSIAGFLWPTKGKIVSQFGPKKGGLYNDGINISAKEGASIKAADGGEVVYSGNELRGYGNLVLIKHPNGFVTAYAHAEKIVVKKGDEVQKGQTIAYVGSTGHVSTPQLHFSIRQGRKAIDPQKYLPIG
jgi:murein DD-endopeptidase MepM/ murein hydrolase activator NlpD